MSNEYDYSGLYNTSGSGQPNGQNRSPSRAPPRRTSSP